MSITIIQYLLSNFGATPHQKENQSQLNILQFKCLCLLPFKLSANECCITKGTHSI